MPDDDEDRHQGRQRQHPHVKGQWALHAFIPIPLPFAYHQQLSELTASENVDNLFQVSRDDVHLSLTRTGAFVREFQIQPVVERLRVILAQTLEFRIAWSADYKVLVNEGSSRSFLTLAVGAGARKMKTLLTLVDSVMREFDIVTFYEDAQFHASVAWWHGIDDNVTHLSQANAQVPVSKHLTRSHLVSELKLSVGDQTHVIHLKKNKSDTFNPLLRRPTSRPASNSSIVGNRQLRFR